MHKIIPAKIPQHNLSYMPDGFTITKVGKTGVSVVDGFCTPEEAQEIIDICKDRVAPAGVLIDGKFVVNPGRQSDTVPVFGPGGQDPQFLPMACRAAALVGLPYTHMDGVYVTRYLEGGFYKEHLDFTKDFLADRLYTVLVYLNDMEPEESGSTAFPSLNFAVHPRVGRAVSWTNKNPDGSPHMETSHAALPVHPGGEKWTIQFWFHAYKMFNAVHVVPPQSATGVAIGENEELPDGANYFVRDES